MISRLSRPARTQVTALIVAAAGIVVQIIAGVNYPAVAVVAGIAALIVGNRRLARA